MNADDHHVHARAARLFHTLSSFGWFEEPAIAAGAPQIPPKAIVAGDEAIDALAKVLAARTSQRAYTGAPLSADELLVLAWCGYGRTSEFGVDVRSTVPSAGGLYPSTLVVLPLAVTGIARRLYRFNPERLDLQPLSAPLPDPVSSWFRTQHVDYGRAAAVLLVATDLNAPERRYGERGYRYALLEAGHVVQNLCLGATALNLGATPIGGFDDDRVNDALRDDLGADIRIVYSLAVGRVEIPRDDAAAGRVLRALRRRERAGDDPRGHGSQ